MSIQLPGRVLLVLALLVGVQSTWVDPTASAAELRAMSCCAHDCEGPVSLPGARRCCGVTTATSGPAEGPISRSAVTAPLVAVAALRPPLPLPIPVGVAAGIAGTPGTGPPVFLEQRHLLL